MLEYFYEWIREIAYYMVLVTVIMQLAAGQSYRKYIRLFTGIILVLMIVSPVIRLLGGDGEDAILSVGDDFREAAAQIEEKIQEMEQNTLPEIVAGTEENGGDGEQDDEIGGIEVEEIRIGR